MREIYMVNLKRISDIIFSSFDESSPPPSLIGNKSGLMGGNGGPVLFLYYYSAFAGGEKFRFRAERLLNNIYDSINDASKVEFSYCHGLIGLFSLLFHLQRVGYIHPDYFEYNRELEDVIRHKIEQEIESSNYDFLFGILGYLLLFILIIENAPSSARLEYLENIMDKLICDFPKRQRIIEERGGKINFGIPHGISGWILLLCKIKRLGLCGHQSEWLLNKLVASLTPFVETKRGRYSYFPAVQDREESFPDSRLGWCYGDLGCCLALLNYEELYPNRDLKESVVKILKNASERRLPENTAIRDAGICHGTSGVGFIFHLLQQRFQLFWLEDTVDYWYSRTLELYDETRKYGYSFVRILNGKEVKIDDISLLFGISGIGLSLISYLNPEFSSWGELFLLDL